MLPAHLVNIAQIVDGLGFAVGAGELAVRPSIVPEPPVSEPEVVFLQENSLQFLTKILGACKLNIGDIAIVNIEQFPTSFELIKKKLLPTICILFDVKATSIALPFTIPDYQIQKYGGCTFLMAPAIASFDGATNEAKLAKTKLWVSLKTIFNL